MDGHCVCCLSTAVTPFNFFKSFLCKCWFKAFLTQVSNVQGLAPSGVFPVLPSLLPIPPSHLILRVTAPDLAARKFSIWPLTVSFRGCKETTGFRTARLRVQTPSDRPAPGIAVASRYVTLPGSAAASAAGACLRTAPRVVIRSGV